LENVFNYWSVITSIITVIVVVAVSMNITKQNTSEIKDLKDSHKLLEDKCNEMIKDKTAREIFVNKEVFATEMKHIHKTLDSVKATSDKILEYVRK
jgi:hypothetical protein